LCIRRRAVLLEFICWDNFARIPWLIKPTTVFRLAHRP
jgi:hypothetical protein